MPGWLGRVSLSLDRKVKITQMREQERARPGAPEEGAEFTGAEPSRCDAGDGSGGPGWEGWQGPGWEGGQGSGWEGWQGPGPTGPGCGQRLGLPLLEPSAGKRDG